MNSDQYGQVTGNPLNSSSFSDQDSGVEAAMNAANGQPSEESADPDPGSSELWRNELAARLNRYRSRRKPRPPRYPSLRLKFDPPASTAPSSSAKMHPEFEPASDNALALDGLSTPEIASLQNSVVEPAPALAEVSPQQPASSKSGARIIPFPSFGPPAPSPDELAEPVLQSPRILEVPEFEPPPPALGGITIEPAEVKELERRPGIDFPLQTAPLLRRILAAGVDGLIVALAEALFGLVFWKICAFEPPRLQLIGIATALPLLLWISYQSAMLAYSGTTPGLRAAGLCLERFDGSRANRRLGRVRALASLLSLISLGMGYLWVFLDEDSLCWHDRITHTFLAERTLPKNIES